MAIMKYSSNSLKVEIERSNTGGTFTNYDEIKGIIRLVVTGSISVSCIVVKLQGIAKSEMMVPWNRRKGGSRRNTETDNLYLEDVHKILYDTVVVFPPENVRKVSKAQEFTLTPGTYSYPFEFRIPLNNSCVKMEGITNKVGFNKRRMDLVFKNGNLTSDYIKNRAKGYLSDQMGIKGPAPPYTPTHPNHVNEQLPPSLSGKERFASVKYYVKATCKRASIFKPNIRAFDPFVFLPLDLDTEWQQQELGGDYEEYKEMFVRKEIVFKNRIPDIVGVKIPSDKSKPITYTKAESIQPRKPTIRKRFFEKGPDLPSQSSGHVGPVSSKSEYSQFPKINPTDISFAFEARFRHPHFLVPTKRPSFKLYLVSNTKPSKYSLAEYDRPEDSNGLGVVYLHHLKVILNSITTISVIEDDSSKQKIHRSQNEESLVLCDNNYHNLKFDLKNSSTTRSSSATSSASPSHYQYELEIPDQHFENCIVPDHVAPSFRTCNIARKYDLSVVASFSCEKLSNSSGSHDTYGKLANADLHCPNIKILSGLSMTSKLHSASSTSIDSSSRNQQPPVPFPAGSSGASVRKSSSASQHLSQPDDARNHDKSSTSLDSISDLNSSLPNYNDVILQSSFQNEGDHLRARRRYQQHERYYHDTN